MLFGKKNVVDERERMEMYKVEHYMFWFAFWALLVSIFGQLIFMKASFGQIAGEWTVFMLMAVGTVIGEFRGGHYDYISSPGWRSYLAYSVGGTAAFVLLILLNGMLRGYYDSIGDMALAVSVSGGIMFVLLYVSLSIGGALVKKRRKKLEEEFDDEDES